ATTFLILSAINTKPSSLLTLFVPLTDIRVKPKIAFINPKTGSTFHFSLIVDFFCFWFRKLLIDLGFEIFPVIISHYFLFDCEFDFIQSFFSGHSEQSSHSYNLKSLLNPYLSWR